MLSLRLHTCEINGFGLAFGFFAFVCAVLENGGCGKSKRKYCMPTPIHLGGAHKKKKREKRKNGGSVGAKADTYTQLMSHQ